MSCDFVHHAGSYVLGALSPAERQAFEKHLSGCAQCARSVRELAGMPGLLARVDPDVLEAPPVEEPVPDTLLPALVHQVRRTQRRRTFVTAGAAAAAVVAVIVGSLAVAGSLNGDRTPPSAGTPTPRETLTMAEGQAMMPVGHAPVHATLTFHRMAWGTRLYLACTYTPRGGRVGSPPAATYALFVLTRDGRTEQVATWRSLPGKTLRLAAVTAASRKEIASVEVRTADGKPVLKLTT